MTETDLNAAIATFDTRAAALAAADAAMPRRKHDRPYAQASGWHWSHSVVCPACGAAPDAECTRIDGRPSMGLHSERRAAARAMGPAADRWIVCARANIVLLRDGSMYDYQRRTVIRP